MKKKLILSALLSSSLVNLSPIALADVQEGLNRELTNLFKKDRIKLVSKTKHPINGKEYFIEFRINNPEFVHSPNNPNKIKFAMSGMAWLTEIVEGKTERIDLLKSSEDGNVIFQLANEDKHSIDYYIHPCNSSMNECERSFATLSFLIEENQWVYSSKEAQLFDVALNIE